MSNRYGLTTRHGYKALYYNVKHGNCWVDADGDNFSPVTLAMSLKTVNIPSGGGPSGTGLPAASSFATPGAVIVNTNPGNTGLFTKDASGVVHAIGGAAGKSTLSADLPITIADTIKPGGVIDHHFSFDTTKIDANTAGVAANKAAAAANTAAIATNKTDIATNTTNIAANTAAIAAVSGALLYKGTSDVTAAAPSGAKAGDVYINTTKGVPDASWTGLAAAVSIDPDALLIYDGTNWSTADLSSTALTTVTASLPLSVDLTIPRQPALAVRTATDKLDGVVTLASDVQAIDGTTTDRVITPAQAKLAVERWGLHYIGHVDLTAAPPAGWASKMQHDAVFKITADAMFSNTPSKHTVDPGWEAILTTPVYNALKLGEVSFANQQLLIIDDNDGLMPFGAKGSSVVAGAGIDVSVSGNNYTVALDIKALPATP